MRQLNLPLRGIRPRSPYTVSWQFLMCARLMVTELAAGEISSQDARV
jgi:hypothetical protein